MWCRYAYPLDLCTFRYCIPQTSIAWNQRKQWFWSFRKRKATLNLTSYVQLILRFCMICSIRVNDPKIRSQVPEAFCFGNSISWFTAFYLNQEQFWEMATHVSTSITLSWDQVNAPDARQLLYLHTTSCDNLTHRVT